MKEKSGFKKNAEWKSFKCMHPDRQGEWTEADKFRQGGGDQTYADIIYGSLDMLRIRTRIRFPAENRVTSTSHNSRHEEATPLLAPPWP